jgi:enamine deaminase RidA (YjgF/YER057c/UK114 family)
MAAFDVVVPTAQRHVYDEWHLAPAVRAGEFLFCSGVLGVQADGRVPSDPAEQYRVAFANLAELLDAGGADLTDVVELVSFHIGLEEQIRSFSEIKDQFIHAPYPAWTAVGVSELGGGALPGALVEIKATARIGRAT